MDPERMWARQEARAEVALEWWHLAGGRPGLRVADAGCGPGALALRYAALTGPTGHVHAVDPDPAMLGFLHGQLDPVHHAHVTTELLEVQRAPLPDLAFDAVFLTHVLHHLDEPVAALRNLRESRGAVLLVAEFHPEGPGEVGPPPSERVAPRVVEGWLREAGWVPGRVVRQPFEQYCLVAR